MLGRIRRERVKIMGRRKGVRITNGVDGRNRRKVKEVNGRIFITNIKKRRKIKE